MSRNRGKRTSKWKNVMSDIPDLDAFIEKSVVEVMTQRGVAEMGYFETLILEDYGQRQWDLFQHMGVETVIKLSTELGKPWFEGAKLDMGGVSHIANILFCFSLIIIIIIIIFYIIYRDAFGVMSSSRLSSRGSFGKSQEGSPLSGSLSFFTGC